MAVCLPVVCEGLGSIPNPIKNTFFKVQREKFLDIHLVK